jgi:hypothetical protein
LAEQKAILKYRASVIRSKEKFELVIATYVICLLLNTEHNIEKKVIQEV